MWLDEDSSSLYYVARALLKMQIMYGFFPCLRGLGAKAKLVCEMLARMRREMSEE